MAITSADLISPSSNVLYKQFGFKNPNNNIGAMFNRLNLSSYERAAMGAGLATELEPQRQGAIRALVANNNPANMAANARARGGALYNQSTQQGSRAAQMLAMRGASAGTQLGAIANSQNQGTESANQLLLNAYSPEAQNAALASVLQAIAQAPGSGLQELLAMSPTVSQKEQDRMARKAGQGLAPFAALAGDMLSGVNWGNVFAKGGANQAVSKGATK